MALDYAKILKEVEAINSSLKTSIKHMPRWNRYNAGDRIILLMLDIKVSLKLVLKGVNYELDNSELYNNLLKLGIIIDDCLEDGSLLLKGKYTVIEPRTRLITKKFILSHLNDWVSHIHIGVSYKKIVR